MKYLKLFESYNNFNEVKGEIEDIKFILQDLKDDRWIVNIDFVAKRWENHIKSDMIKIYIKKNACKSGSKYPLDSEFNPFKIKDEINTILSIFKENEKLFRICTSDNDTYYNSKLIGRWNSVSKSHFEKILNNSEPYNKILGLEIDIYLETKNIDQIVESFDIDDDSEHLNDLSLDLKDEGEWDITIHTNTEKYNENEYSCRVILEPLDLFDWDEEGINKKGGKINDTLIQYLENIIRYMEDYDYKIILTEDGNDLAPGQYEDQEIILNSIEEFKKWIEKELKHQKSNIMTYGYKGDLIIIEFYEKELNESDSYNPSYLPVIKYKYDWCKPTSPIRNEIENYINDILSELKEDKTYTSHSSWVDTDPYIWIAGSLKKSRGMGNRYNPVLSEVEPYIKQITSYLNSEGFSSEVKYFPTKENCKEFYINFKMI